MITRPNPAESTAGRARAGRILPALLVLAAAPAAQGQEAPSCQLRVRVVAEAGSDEQPRSNMLAIPGAEGRYAMHLGGGLVLGRCGDATMTGDSAVHLEHIAQALMIGSVHYRDTTRVLDADRVTYFGLTDEVVAEGDVRLERLAFRRDAGGAESGFPPDTLPGKPHRGDWKTSHDPSDRRSRHGAVPGGFRPGGIPGRGTGVRAR